VTPEEARCWHDDVASIADLLSAGVPRQTIRRRVRAERWGQPCSTVVCPTTGSMTSRQWMLAALAHGGPGTMLSHETAGSFWGFATVATGAGATGAGGTGTGAIHVTVPHGRRRASTGTIHVHQSRRPCEPRFVEDLLVTPPARTAVDMALDLGSASSAAALLGRVMQTGRVTLDRLAHELDLAPSRGSRLPRTALADLAVGSRSAAESRLVYLVRRAGIPLPEMNAPVTTRLGTRYVDALWRSLGKGIEVDGQAFHLDAAAWQADLVRQNAIQSEGIVLLRIAARRLWTDPDAVLEEIRAFLGLSRP
jgi:very-short-patch-repair endonuclease